MGGMFADDFNRAPTGRCRTCSSTPTRGCGRWARRCMRGAVTVYTRRRRTAPRAELRRRAGPVRDHRRPAGRGRRMTSALGEMRGAARRPDGRDRGVPEAATELADGARRHRRSARRALMSLSLHEARTGDLRRRRRRRWSGPGRQAARGVSPQHDRRTWSAPRRSWPARRRPDVGPGSATATAIGGAAGRASAMAREIVAGRDDTGWRSPRSGWAIVDAAEELARRDPRGRPRCRGTGSRMSMLRHRLRGPRRRHRATGRGRLPDRGRRRGAGRAGPGHAGDRGEAIDAARQRLGEAAYRERVPTAADALEAAPRPSRRCVAVGRDVRLGAASRMRGRARAACMIAGRSGDPAVACAPRAARRRR